MHKIGTKFTYMDCEYKVCNIHSANENYVLENITHQYKEVMGKTVFDYYVKNWEIIINIKSDKWEKIIERTLNA